MNRRITKYVYCVFAVAFLIFMLYFMYSTAAHFLKGSQLMRYDLDPSRIASAREYAKYHYIVGALSLVGFMLTAMGLIDSTGYIQKHFKKERNYPQDYIKEVIDLKESD